MKKRPQSVDSITLFLILIVFIIFDVPILPAALASGDTVLMILSGILLILSIYFLVLIILSIKNNRAMARSHSRLTGYLRDNRFSEIYAEKICRSFVIDTAENQQLNLIIYDPVPTAITFQKADSLVPERYDFYLTADGSPYLCVHDVFKNNIYTFKKHLP